MARLARPDPVLLSLGRRIAELRSGRGVTREAFAERLEVSVRHLAGIETGRVNLSVLAVAKIAKALRASLADLFAAPASTRITPGRPRSVAR